MHFVQRTLDHTAHGTPQTITWPAGRVRFDNGELAPPYFYRVASVVADGAPALAVWCRGDEIDSEETFGLEFVVLPFDAVINDGTDGFLLVGTSTVEGVPYHVMAHESIFAGA